MTARNTPQQNHLAELGFAHLANLGQALMNHANVPPKWCYKRFAKAFKTATLLDGLHVIELNRKGPIQGSNSGVAPIPSLLSISVPHGEKQALST